MCLYYECIDTGEIFHWFLFPDFEMEYDDNISSDKAPKQLA